MASILIIGPHPDDQELGMGGLNRQIGRAGTSRASGRYDQRRAHAASEPRDSVATESAAAAKILGVERTNLGLPNREVVHSIEARHKLAAVIRVHRPNWLFLPHPLDAHPDHIATTRIGEDARFDAKLTKSAIPGEPWYPKRIIYYYCTHLRMNFQPLFYLDISQQIETKMAAIRAYESQFVENNSPVVEMVRTMAAFYGGRIGDGLCRTVLHARGPGARRVGSTLITLLFSALSAPLR